MTATAINKTVTPTVMPTIIPVEFDPSGSGASTFNMCHYNIT